MRSYVVLQPTRALLVAGMLAGIIAPVAIADDRLPGTLNFKNVTAERVVPTIGEIGSNEKEIDIGDFDNDNDLDIVVAVAYSDFNTRRNKLYRNDNGIFNEVSGAPIIPGFSDRDVTRSAFLRDYDGDGWLDIIVINDNNTGGQAGRTKLYMNQHPGGIFSHYLEDGINRLGPNTGGAACSGISIDIDQDDDADIDLYVGNYPNSSQDTMYFNDGNGFFSNKTGTHVPTDSDYTVDVSTADINGDGQIDLLLANDNDPNYIYYNNNLDAAGATGDFRYGSGGNGAKYNLGRAGRRENAMEPGDFNGDGLVDIYWANRGPNNTDKILQNMGNDGNNEAFFSEVSLPAFVSANQSRKATVADLNADSRPDIVVMAESARPEILRNTSVKGDISFVSWTPANTFPNGTQHKGWHVAVFDTNGDGDKDIFLGGWTNDHLFENIPSNEVVDGDLGTANLPPLHNIAPVAVDGTIGTDETDEFVATDIPSNASVSVVLNGSEDYTLEIRNSGGNLIASSDRGKIGIEEAVQLTAPGGDLSFLVISQGDIAGDGDGDGFIDWTDFGDMQQCFTDDESLPEGCEIFDFNDDGVVNPLDLVEFEARRADPDTPAVRTYILEVLSRN